MGKYKFTYFPVYARGETARLVFAQAGVEFEDIRVNREQWGKLKASGKTPFGQIPILELPDGKIFSQGLAISRFLAKEFNLYSSKNSECLKIDMVLEVVEDVLEAVAKYNFESDNNTKRELLTKLKEEVFPTNFQGLENLLNSNQGGKSFFVGDSVTVADLSFFNISDIIFNVIDDAEFHMRKYKNLAGLKKRVASLPNVATYLNSRPESVAKM